MRLRQCVFVCKDLEGSSEELCDILGIEGTLFRTRTGELTIQARSVRLLTKRPR